MVSPRLAERAQRITLHEVVPGRAIACTAFFDVGVLAFLCAHVHDNKDELDKVCVVSAVACWFRAAAVR